MKTGMFHVLLLLFAVSIIRLPSFFFSVFDWDESTFIIVGQSIVDGNMPYVDAWDIKPPLAYYVYALFISLFGKSFFSIRLGGILCIYAASILLYKTGQALNNRVAGVIAALFLILFTGSGPSGLSTMTEHILLVPLSLILYLMFTVEIDRSVAFAIGVMLGTAILVRTNTVFESLAVFLILSAGFLRPGNELFERLKRGAILLMGISLPVLIMGCIYFAGNHLDLLLKTNITAVSNYLGSEASSFPRKFEILFRNIGDNIRLNPLLWMTFFLGTLYLAFFRKINNSFLPAALLIFFAQILSLFFSSQPFGYHYLIAAMPILSLVSGVALSHWISERKSGRRIYRTVTILIIAAGMFYSLQGNVVKHYKKIISHIVGKQPLFDDSCYRIADFLRINGAENQYIYMVNSCQIVYWLTGSRYPTKYIHPTNLLLREYMLKIMDGPDATKEKELLAILDKRPLFIVHRSDLWPPDLETFKTLLDNELSANYEAVMSIDTYYQIYRRENLK